MTTRLNPYIGFKGNAREAMEFYKSVLGGSLQINTFGEFGATDAADPDKVMHAMLETPSGLALMGADTPEGMPHSATSNMSISLSGEDARELHGYWERLSQAGTVTMPLEKQVWGDEFGMCTDQFGIAWMVNIVQPQP